jgi:hypothetical protein
MTTKFSVRLFLLSATLLAAAAVQAHHSFSEFDRNVQRVVKGEVTRWVFNNPHVWLELDSTDASGETTHWAFEGGGVVHMIRTGVNGSTFKAGDQVTVMYCPLRDGRQGGALGWVKVGDGPMINPNDGGCRANAEINKQWEEWLEKGYTSNLEAQAAL